MNKRKMENLATFIETKVPKRQFSFFSYICTRALFTSLKTIGECKTTCCIAGWEVLRRGKTLDRAGNVVDQHGTIIKDINDFARESLGLTSQEAFRLFVTCFSFPNTPKGAAARIRHMIETGM